MNMHEFLTPQQVADLLQLPRRSVLSLCRRGELGARRLGRLWRIPREAIERVFAPTAAEAQRP